MQLSFSVYRHALELAARSDVALRDLGEVARPSADVTTESARFSTRVEGMVHWCRTVENLLVARADADCRIWAGFERLSRIRRAHDRYEALARRGARIVLFGAPDVAVILAGAEVVPLAGGPLLDEWFLLVQSERYSALLSAIDLDGLRDEGWNRARSFRAIATHDPRVIEGTVEALEAARR